MVPGEGPQLCLLHPPNQPKRFPFFLASTLLSRRLHPVVDIILSNVVIYHIYIIYIYIYIYIIFYLSIHMRTHTHAYMYVCMYVRVYIYIYMHIYTAHMCMYV